MIHYLFEWLFLPSFEELVIQKLFWVFIFWGDIHYQPRIDHYGSKN